MSAKGVIDVIRRLGSESEGLKRCRVYVLSCKEYTPEQAQESLSSDWVVYVLPDDAMRANVRVAVNSKAMSVVVFNGNVWRLFQHRYRDAFAAQIENLNFAYWQR